MSILHRIRWGRVGAAGVAIILVTMGLGSSEESPPLTSHSVDIITHDAEVAKPDSTLLANRPWIDHMPRNERDMVTQLVFLDKDGKKMGAMLRASRWRQLAELFKWEPRKTGVTVHFPQLDKKVPVNTRTWACKAPKGFDLCMEISILGKGLRLYSNKRWKLDEPDTYIEDTQGYLLFDPEAINESLDDEMVFEELSAQ